MIKSRFTVRTRNSQIWTNWFRQLFFCQAIVSKRSDDLALSFKLHVIDLRVFSFTEIPSSLPLTIRRGHNFWQTSRILKFSKRIQVASFRPHTVCQKRRLTKHKCGKVSLLRKFRNTNLFMMKFDLACPVNAKNMHIVLTWWGV